MTALGDAGDTPLHDPAYHRALGDDLILRWSTREDAERIADVVAEVFGKEDHPSEDQRKVVFESMRPGYPHGRPGDWAIVEHQGPPHWGLPTGRIVAATALMNQTWTYDGIPFGVGRPEQVVTRREYRERGLSRAIFELLHARSVARGHLVQVIDGIPFFYRQLGYEYALESFGGVRLYWSAIDADKVAEPDEPYRLRDATLQDVPLLTRLHASEQSDSLVSVRVDDAYWHWALDPEHGQDHTNENGWRPLIITDAQHENASVGCLILRDGYHWSDPSALAVVSLATERGVPLRGVLPSVLRSLKRLLPTLGKATTGDPPLRLLFLLGSQHPVYQALDSNIITPARRPYAWYVRVPDVAAFITLVAPALERRLDRSPFAGQSVTLSVSFYRGLLHLTIKDGRLESAEERTSRRGMLPGETGGAGAAMPRNQFVQLLFGYRSLEELRDTYPDVIGSDEELRLLEALFPKRFSRPLLVS